MLFSIFHIHYIHLKKIKMFPYCIINIKRKIHSKFAKSIDLALQIMKNSNIRYNGGGLVHKIPSLCT
jgi:hypothetical protein